MAHSQYAVLCRWSRHSPTTLCQHQYCRQPQPWYRRCVQFLQVTFSITCLFCGGGPMPTLHCTELSHQQCCNRHQQWRSVQQQRNRHTEYLRVTSCPSTKDPGPALLGRSGISAHHWGEWPCPQPQEQRWWWGWPKHLHGSKWWFWRPGCLSDSWLQNRWWFTVPVEFMPRGGCQ